jgi:hypothetical protein
MDDDDMTQQEPPVEGRNQHFGAGMVGGQLAPPQSLQDLAARYRAQTPTGYRPSGTSNGMSADQYQATMGGMYGNSNGSSADTWSTMKFFGNS